MIYILSWTTKKHQKILAIPLNSKLKKIRTLLSKVGTPLQRLLMGLPGLQTLSAYEIIPHA